MKYKYHFNYQYVKKMSVILVFFFSTLWSLDNFILFVACYNVDVGALIFVYNHLFKVCFNLQF